MNYFLNINKPRDWTSFDVVKKVRGMIGTKKVGHLGTLDPFATGVLPLAVNKATKLIQYLQDDDKEYIAEVRFGANSTTCDLEGDLTEVNPEADVAIEKIEAELVKFVGVIDQVPPKVSAIKVNGRRAYTMARAGVEFELKSRKVRVESIDVISYEWPVLRLRVVCGKGFYVRGLARDMGKNLGVGGYLTALERTMVGKFNKDNWLSMEAVESGDFDVARVSMLEAWDDRPKYYLDAGELKQVRLGQFVKMKQVITDVVAGIFDGEFVCLLEPVAKVPGMMKMKMRL